LRKSTHSIYAGTVKAGTITTLQGRADFVVPLPGPVNVRLADKALHAMICQNVLQAIDKGGILA